MLVRWWHPLLQRWFKVDPRTRWTAFPRFSIFILFFCRFVSLFFFCHFRTAHYKCKSIYKIVEHMLWILFCIMLALPNSFEWYTRVSWDLKNFLSTTLFAHALDFILYNTGTAHFIWMVHQSFTNRPNQNFLLQRLTILFESRLTLETEKTDLACHSYRLRDSFEKNMHIQLNPA